MSLIITPRTFVVKFNREMSLAKEFAKPKVHVQNQNLLACQPRVINLASHEDCLRLKEWCEFHWSKSIKPCLENKNRVIFHACCISFSKRSFSYKAGHPPEQSMSLKRVRPFKSGMSSESDFYDWLISVLKAREVGGKKPIMPVMNSYHFQSTSLDTETMLKELHSLRKENDHLVSEFRQVTTQNQVLMKDNERLRLSSVTWFNKYNDYLNKRAPVDVWGTKTPSFETPMKKVLFSLSRGSSPMNLT